MKHLHNGHGFRDKDYLCEIKAGGSRADRAIGYFYIKYRKRAYAAMARCISKHPEYKGGAADLVHDALIIMVQKIQCENLEVQSLAGYWIGIGKYLFLNQLKKDERIILVRESEEVYGLNEASPEVLLEDVEEQEQLEYTFAKLGPRCKEILLLWINQYTMIEIAAQMGLANDAMARKIKHDCFNKLKELVRTGNKIPG